ncbi:hypothetical protein SAV31267_008400 [Streptomyces avermitilis]|uniref:Uncharacterized protein n=1 Tax=Streptomyces avermitilis TaxID=33903 RepID=A0A4D4MI38_STRAX|nr:hypothetical protein SAV31267_008400 [Streptomyces avermitilis]
MTQAPEYAARDMTVTHSFGGARTFAPARHQWHLRWTVRLACGRHQVAGGSAPVIPFMTRLTEAARRPGPETARGARRREGGHGGATFAP